MRRKLQMTSSLSEHAFRSQWPPRPRTPSSVVFSHVSLQVKNLTPIHKNSAKLFNGNETQSLDPNLQQKTPLTSTLLASPCSPCHKCMQVHLFAPHRANQRKVASSMKTSILGKRIRPVPSSRDLVFLAQSRGKPALPPSLDSKLNCLWDPLSILEGFYTASDFQTQVQILLGFGHWWKIGRRGLVMSSHWLYIHHMYEVTTR
ncbi:hypothetical protein QBC35DRAFT_256155 [Podospora australis]|uniref:Uncharacterized protein n=1 Tax=Podospora australis TaxID=1536484 RepID=A0AAN6WR91_9PEZI|nr:hypothetical protein QBC35DRAFT_256155 [Podospora australis]